MLIRAHSISFLPQGPISGNQSMTSLAVMSHFSSTGTIRVSIFFFYTAAPDLHILKTSLSLVRSWILERLEHVQKVDHMESAMIY